MATGDYKFLKVNSGNTFDEVTFLPTDGSIMGFDANLNPINLPSPYAGLTTGAIVKKAANGFADSVLFESGGKIGIGTSSPSSLLHLISSDDYTDLIIANAKVTSASRSRLLFRNGVNTSEEFRFQFSDSDFRMVYFNGTTGTNVYSVNLSNNTISLGWISNFGAGFEMYGYQHSSRPGQFRAIYNEASIWMHYDGSSYLERMRLTDSGRIGIGTSSPTELLDVNGNVKANGFKVGADAGVDASSGTLKAVTVKKGIITAGTSVTPIADGTHDLIGYRYIQTSGGIITALIEDN